MTLSILIDDLRGGGAERVTVNLANELAQRGYSVDLVLIQCRGVLLQQLDARIRIVSLAATSIRQAFLPYIKYLKANKPETILAVMWPSTSLAVIANRLFNTKARVLVSEHTTWSRSRILQSPFKRRLARYSMAFTFSWADVVITVSRGAADDLARFAALPRGRVMTIYNPIVPQGKPAVLDLTSVIAQWPQAQYRLLAVGCLKPVKDFPTLLQALKQLRQRVDASLLILGEGEERDNILAEARRLGIEQYVKLPGFCNELDAFYQAADVFVLSSSAEGFGNVIVEALAQGLSVVSTDCRSGPREILADGLYGQLVPVGDAKFLAASIERVLYSPFDSASLMARARAFTIDRITDQYLALMMTDDPLLMQCEEQ